MDPIAFGALIKRKRGEARLTQVTLAGDVYGDPGRNADISRIENGNVTPQEATIQKLCRVLNISPAEMEPIRQARPAAEQLANIPSLSREDLQNLAARFGIENPFERPDRELQHLLTLKANEHRTLKSEVDAIDEGLKRLSNLKAAAQDAIANVDLDEVEKILSRVQEVELDEAAKTAELRAQNALLRGNVAQAYKLLKAAADSFSGVNPEERISRILYSYAEILWRHTLRFGGEGFALTADLVAPLMSELADKRSPNHYAAALVWKGTTLRDQATRTGGPEGADLLAQSVTAYRAVLQVYTRADHPVDWARAQNNLGNALWAQATRTGGPEGAKLLAQAVTAFRAALQVHTRADHPLDWARAQNNLGNALWAQATRTGGPDGADLQAQAVTAYRAALQVRTRADHPVDWARTQENLAIAERARAELPTTKDPAQHLRAALRHVDAALEIYDPVHLSYDHGRATRLRDRILAQINAP